MPTQWYSNNIREYFLKKGIVMNDRVSQEAPSVAEANGVEVDLKALLANKAATQEGVEGEDSAPVKPNRPN